MPPLPGLLGTGPHWQRGSCSIHGLQSVLQGFLPEWQVITSQDPPVAKNHHQSCLSPQVGWTPVRLPWSLGAGPRMELVNPGVLPTQLCRDLINDRHAPRLFPTQHWRGHGTPSAPRKEEALVDGAGRGPWGKRLVPPAIGQPWAENGRGSLPAQDREVGSERGGLLWKPWAWFQLGGGCSREVGLGVPL